MKKKAVSFFVLIALLSILLTGCGTASGSSSEGATVLRLAENHPDDYPTTIGDKEFARLVEEKTDGRYKIEVFSGGQLGEESDTLELVQIGTIDLVRTNVTPVTQLSDEIGVLSMPFLFESEEDKWEKLNGEVGQELLDTLDGSNLVGLAYYDSGERSIYNTKRPLESPEDMKGLKIRVQNSALSIEIIEALGASATPMEYGEVFSALQTGVIDGAENNFPSYFTSNHYNVANYFTVNGYSGTPELLMASQSLWDTLSDEDKGSFLEAARESVEVQREAWAELTEEAREAVVEGGSELVEINDIEEWRDAVQPLYDKYDDLYGDWIDRLSE
ncbi:TRAP transporter substrate-binding protein [Oceanobacillus sp. FSL H7-0719]|uniref:TRAP transporter substrate-binding protein n=1 Tax=Oceanobacillus sp. FSL H7-0719 TaxID=2954507 RepID=UPI00324DED09